MFTLRYMHILLEIWDSILCVIMALCTYWNKGFAEWKRRILMNMYIYAVILMIMDACAWGFDGYSGKAGYYIVRMSIFFAFIAANSLLLTFHGYICQHILGQAFEETDEFHNRIGKIPCWSYSVYCLGGVSILLVIVAQFTGLYYYFDTDNFCHRNTFFPIALLMPLLELMLDLSLIIKFRRRLKKALFVSMTFYVALSAAAGGVMLFFNGISLVHTAITLSLFFMFIAAVMEQGRELAKKEKEMCDIRAELLLSQISPHFIYNTLTTIKHLCKKDAGLAAETVDEFAGYLRGNLDSLMGNRKILFSEELIHTKKYIAIEKKRFGKRVNVTYEIREDSFMVPALTLQPIVENAIKHGITKREQGGTICISTGKDDTDYWIAVEDDGVGYHTDAKQEKGHIGIPNVTSRVESICGGRVSIVSTYEGGTTVLIRIPRERG